MRPQESFIEQPVRSLQTMLRVIASDDPSIPVVIPDGIYSPSTMQAISAFQRKYSLPITGITDQKTWDTVVTVYEPALIRNTKAQPIEILLDAGQVLKSGDKSPYVYLAQAMLLSLSDNHPIIPSSEVTGIIEDTTVESIAAFQKLAGLPQTGEVDRITWKHLVLHFTQDAHRSGANYIK